MQGARPVLSLGPRAGYAFVATVLALPLVAFVIEIACDLGAAASDEYYSTVAQISGTVFAILLGVLALLRPHFDVASANTRRYLEFLGGGLLLQVVIAAGLSLYAIAAAESTTFLTLATALTLGFQLFTALFFGFVSAFPEIIASKDEMARTRGRR